MRETRIRSKEMSSSAFVDEARGWVRDLVRQESRFPGDFGPAMVRVARQLRVPASKLKKLLYEPPKAISVDVYLALKSAVMGGDIDVDAVRQRHERLSASIEERLARIERILARQAQDEGG